MIRRHYKVTSPEGWTFPILLIHLSITYHHSLLETAMPPSCELRRGSVPTFLISFRSRECCAEDCLASADILRASFGEPCVVFQDDRTQFPPQLREFRSLIRFNFRLSRSRVACRRASRSVLRKEGSGLIGRGRILRAGPPCCALSMHQAGQLVLSAVSS